MKISLRILTACALAACAITGMAQSKALQIAPRGIKVDPIRVAKAVASKDANGKLTFKRVGDWIPYKKSVGTANQTLVAYDEYEFADPTGVDLTPGDNPTYTGCASAGLRWYFGAGYLPGIRFNDMKVVAAAAGQQSTRSGIAWFQELDAVNDMQYFMFTSEQFPDDVNGIDPNDEIATGMYEGIVASFGALANGGGGYYFSDIDLDGSGLSWQLPMDGEGGAWQLHGDVDPNNNITIVGQAMLWGINPGNPTPPCSDLQWDDDVVVDLILTPDELYSNAFGICPDPLGAMQCYFYAGGASSETLAPTSEQILFGTTNSGGNLASWAADDNNARTICKLFVPSVTSPFVRVNLNYTTTKTTPTAISFNVKVSNHTPGPQGITLSLQDKTNPTVFVNTNVVNQPSIPGTTYSGTATAPLQRYVGTGGAMTGRIEIFQTGPSTSLFPCSSFEFAQMVVTG